jgi:hypothetical protein
MAVADPGEALTCEQRAVFERDGFLVVPGVLDGGRVAEVTAGACRELAWLADHPRVLGPVWSILGWNLDVYHSHVDVHPQVAGQRPFRFGWHQDGGRQNREVEGDPRPRLSVKAVYWLSDVSRGGRRNLRLVPGSHRTNWIEGPPRRDMAWPDPAGAIEVRAGAGDVVLFDRRIWHARSINRSTTVRKAVFFGYTYRWVRARDEPPADASGFTPVQRQLLGLLEHDGIGDHAWGHDPATVPLYELLRSTGRLDPDVPALRP